MFGYNNYNLIPILATNSRRTDNYSVILFTNARDEPNIAEWIAHHLLLGFDKVVVFDNLSKNPISLNIKNNFHIIIKKLIITGELIKKLIKLCKYCYFYPKFSKSLNLQ